MSDYKIICGDAAEKLKNIPDASVDMVMTSPPYDNLRTYKGFKFDFKTIAGELWRVVKDGGTVVWVVADGTENGSETGTSFRQALYFKELGFNIHDTMIWNKKAFSQVGSIDIRYPQTFEYMFVFSKGKPKTFNAIKDRRNIHAGEKITSTIRERDGHIHKAHSYGKIIHDMGIRFNVWDINQVKNNKGAGHPAPFPLELARDHIISWSNKGDTVLDPFLGSGTSGVACVDTGRDFIGIEISPEYCELAKRRIDEAAAQIRFDI